MVQLPGAPSRESGNEPFRGLPETKPVGSSVSSGPSNSAYPRRAQDEAIGAASLTGATGPGRPAVGAGVPLRDGRAPSCSQEVTWRSPR